MRSHDGPDALLRGIDESLRDPHPVRMLEFASILAETTATHHLDDLRDQLSGANPRSKVDRSSLIESFLDADMRETDALLLVWGEMLGDPELRDRIRATVTARRPALPNWLRHLDQIRPSRVVQYSHILGDGDNVFIGVETPARSFTIVLYIDHNMGTIPKDGFVIDRPITELITRTLADDAADTELVELLLEDARARLETALAHEDTLLDPITNDTWPAARPLTEWMLRLMPAGGTGYPEHESSEEELQSLTDDFLASEFARGAGADTGDQVHTLLNFATYYRAGDPLRWSNVVVEIVLLDLIPRKVIADARYLGGMPDALRRLIPFAHERRGIPARYTAEALQAIDDFEPGYRASISDQRTGPHAALSAMFADEDDEPIEEYFQKRLVAAVGGMPQLDTLDARPLPDEELSLAGVDTAAVDRVAAIGDLVDRICTEYFENAELRTAARRLLTKIAANDASVFQRGKVENAAVSVTWIVAHANDEFAQRSVKGLLAFAGTKTAPADRAATLLFALGVDWYGDWEFDHALGDASLLTSTRRATLISRRDALRASLAAEGSDSE